MSCVTGEMQVPHGPFQEFHGSNIVAINHENDTCFGKGFVMGYADCKCLGSYHFLPRGGAVCL